MGTAREEDTQKHEGKHETRQENSNEENTQDTTSSERETKTKIETGEKWKTAESRRNNTKGKKGNVDYARAVGRRSPAALKSKSNEWKGHVWWLYHPFSVQARDPLHRENLAFHSAVVHKEI